MEVPGPGAYNQLDSIPKNGKSLYYKYIDSPCTILSSKSKRFNEGNFLNRKKKSISSGSREI